MTMPKHTPQWIHLQQRAEEKMRQFNDDNTCISNKSLKYAKYIIINPLTVLISQTLSTGIFSNELKIARALPLFKNGDTSLHQLSPTIDLYQYSLPFQKSLSML